MAYFNHAFRKTFVMSDYVAPASATTTGALTAGQLSLFNAQTFAPSDVATPECCQFLVVSGSPYTNDRVGPFHGGYQESIKSKGINPRYVTKVWDGLAHAAQNSILHIGTTAWTVANPPAEGDCCPTFLCGENYHLRVDVKGSPALRMLNHQGYVGVTAYGGCCPDQPDDPLIAPVEVDPASIMIQWATGIWESVVVTGNGPNGRINPAPLLIPVVSFATAGVVDALYYPPGTDAAVLAAAAIQYPAYTIDTWDNYVSTWVLGNGDCAGLSLIGAYEETRFGDCTFQPSDFYETEPVRIYASEVDLTGAPCEFTGICISHECEGRKANGLGETAARDFILSESYRQNHFASDLRIREITQGNDMLGTGAGQIDRNGLYDRLMVLHSVPRFNNPSGTFDNDQYLIEVLTPIALRATERAALVKDLQRILDACGNPCYQQAAEDADACPTPSIPVTA